MCLGHQGSPQVWYPEAKSCSERGENQAAVSQSSLQQREQHIPTRRREEDSGDEKIAAGSAGPWKAPGVYSPLAPSVCNARLARALRRLCPGHPAGIRSLQLGVGQGVSSRAPGEGSGQGGRDTRDIWGVTGWDRLIINNIRNNWQKRSRRKAGTGRAKA